MSLQSAVRQILVADSNVTALVGERIRPDMLEQSDGLPAMILRVIQQNPFETLDPTTGNQGIAVIDVECYSQSRAASTQIEDAVKNALNGFDGESGGWALSPISYKLTEFDLEEAEDGGDVENWYANIPRFQIFYTSP